ncbi:Zn-dependent exopeptidases superfamily protein, partial [Striga asiatica]
HPPLPLFIPLPFIFTKNSSLASSRDNRTPHEQNRTESLADLAVTPSLLTSRDLAVTRPRRHALSSDRTRPRRHATFGQHARELIITELALRILPILREEEFLSNVDRSDLNRTLDRLVIKIVPLENLIGRKLVEDGELCERRNGRGVDLIGIGVKPGTAPFSEPETQITRKLAISFEPYIWVNLHSGKERVLNVWSTAFFKMLNIGVMQMDGLQTKAMASSFDNWVSIDDYLNGQEQ